jgi:hypothetical protein
MLINHTDLDAACAIVENDERIGHGVMRHGDAF